MSGCPFLYKNLYLSLVQKVVSVIYTYIELPNVLRLFSLSISLVNFISFSVNTTWVDFFLIYWGRKKVQLKNNSLDGLPSLYHDFYRDFFFFFFFSPFSPSSWMKKKTSRKTSHTSCIFIKKNLKREKRQNWQQQNILQQKVETLRVTFFF